MFRLSWLVEILHSMLMTLNTRSYLPEAARAASVSPCWHTSVKTSTQFGDEPALAKRCMR
jgi:hypothetical protein